MNYHKFNRSPDQHSYCICGELASAPCHQPQDWREAFDEKFPNGVGTIHELENEIPPTYESLDEELKDFVASEKLKSYEEGRAAVVDELLAIWPQEEDERPTENGIPVETYGYEKKHNSLLRTTRAIIESKRTTI